MGNASATVRARISVAGHPFLFILKLYPNAPFIFRIGIDAMIHLLSQTCLFVSLPNDCLCQMTGEPVIHMLPSVSSWTRPATTQKAETATSKKRAVPDPDEHQRPSKRLKVNSPGIVSASRAAVKMLQCRFIHRRLGIYCISQILPG